MILSGIVGSILFSLPNIIAKIIGAIFIHLWFVLDCSDGEVARYTKTFSKYGKELDYMAHLINHPLFGASIFLSLLQLGRYNPSYLFMLVFLSNFLDYGIRNLTKLNVIEEMKEEKNTASKIEEDKFWHIKRIILFATSIFTLYPNFILFGVLIYFVDFYMGTNILYIYLILNVLITGLFVIKDFICKTKYYYAS